jgi:DNA-binding XRE family transcriptional regulator
MNDRMRKQLEKLPPEKRAQAELMLAKYQTPEYREAETSVRESLDREYAETGTIAVDRAPISAEDALAFREMLGRLRSAREAKGMSLDDVARISGLERSAISKLELGTNSNPTVRTITRYARAVSASLVWDFVPTPESASSK